MNEIYIIFLFLIIISQSRKISAAIVQENYTFLDKYSAEIWFDARIVDAYRVTFFDNKTKEKFLTIDKKLNGENKYTFSASGKLYTTCIVNFPFLRNKTFILRDNYIVFQDIPITKEFQKYIIPLVRSLFKFKLRIVESKLDVLKTGLKIVE